MTETKTKILLIEDDPGDALLIENMLAKAGRALFDMERVDRLSAGLEHLNKETFDVVLLDLGLPDSQGIDTFRSMRAVHSEIPILVLTDLKDDITGIDAVREGAQDYLLKGDLGEGLLVRAVRYAMERHYLQKKLKASQERESRQRDQAETVRNYQHYVAMAQRLPTEKAVPQPTLSRENPEKLAFDYRDVILTYVRAVRIREERPSDRVRELARDLVRLRAGARDVVRLHLGVLSEFSQRATPDQDRAFSNDARLVLVELLGNILDIYRELKLASGSERNPAL